MCKLLLLLTSLLLTHFSFSQFNDSTFHRFTFASTGVINKTKDASSFVLNNGIGFNINKKKITQNTAATWIYGKQQHVLSNNDFSANADFDYLKNITNLYYWALVNFDQSYSLKINYRFQSGAGIGYTFFKSPQFNLVASDGFLYETSDLTDPVLGKDIYQTVRNSFRIKYHWEIKNILILDGSHFVQPSLLTPNDYILKSNSSITVKLNKWLGINAAAAYNKISRTDRENLLVTYGITVDKYF